MRKIQGQPYPLGVSKIGNIINFAIEVTGDRACSLLFFQEDKEEPYASYVLQRSFGDVQCLAFENCDDLVFSYKYEIDGEVFEDPYLKNSGILKNDNYNWEDDRPLEIPYHNVIAYSLHVRGFTMDSYSGVKNKGTFEGIVEKIPYLLELGINQIHCMPVYEFKDFEEKKNYWGYGPAYYFSPKNSYSAIGNGHRSLKDMVKALHKAGIEVVLEMPFDQSMPKYMAVDCLRYYVQEYHIDGFVLNPYSAPIEVVRSDAFLRRTKIMEHKTEFKDCMRQFLKSDDGVISAVIYWLKHVSAVDGSFNYLTSHSGFTLYDMVSYFEKHNELNGEGNRDGVDFNNSWNWGIEGETDDEEILAIRMHLIKNAYLLMLLSQGTPCLLAGDEFLNSQNGNNNVYCQDNEVGWINWKNLEEDDSIYEFVKKAIAFRKQYETFHPEKMFLGEDRKNCGIPDISYHGEEAWKVLWDEDNHKLGVFYYSEPVNDEIVYVAYNMHWEAGEFALPKLPGKRKWYLSAETDAGIKEEPVLLDNQKMVEVESRTIVVLTGR